MHPFFAVDEIDAKYKAELNSALGFDLQALLDAPIPVYREQSAEEAAAEDELARQAGVAEAEARHQVEFDAWNAQRDALNAQFELDHPGELEEYARRVVEELRESHEAGLLDDARFLARQAEEAALAEQQSAIDRPPSADTISHSEPGIADVPAAKESAGDNDDVAESCVAAVAFYAAAHAQEASASEDSMTSFLERRQASLVAHMDVRRSTCAPLLVAVTDQCVELMEGLASRVPVAVSQQDLATIISRLRDASKALGLPLPVFGVQ